MGLLFWIETETEVVFLKKRNKKSLPNIFLKLWSCYLYLEIVIY